FLVMYFSPRRIIEIIADAGNYKSTLIFPTDLFVFPIPISRISVLGYSATNSSEGVKIFSFAGRLTLSHLATIPKVVPWTKREVKAIKKTILKIMFAFSIPAKSGYVAKTMGTAPLSPTHEIYKRRLIFILKKARLIKTLSGRATSIKNKEMIIPIPITGTI